MQYKWWWWWWQCFCVGYIVFQFFKFCTVSVIERSIFYICAINLFRPAVLARWNNTGNTQHTDGWNIIDHVVWSCLEKVGELTGEDLYRLWNGKMSPRCNNRNNLFLFKWPFSGEAGSADLRSLFVLHISEENEDKQHRLFLWARCW